jgi:hypothetical protein
MKVRTNLYAGGAVDQAVDKLRQAVTETGSNLAQAGNAIGGYTKEQYDRYRTVWNTLVSL